MNQLTKTQEKQIDFLNKMELTHWSERSLSAVVHHYASCKDCGEYLTLGSAEGCRCFVLNHAGHRTWIDW
jgi:hypothetical protein